MRRRRSPSTPRSTALRCILDGARGEDALCDGLDGEDALVVGAVLRGTADPATL
jgi:hypothetical protein